LGRNLPILDAIIKDTDARALCLFPTKALAQDQLATFAYDGDTPQDARRPSGRRRTSW
jgi:DEAD/DEAH box helicase domain-containing protein